MKRKFFTILAMSCIAFTACNNEETDDKVKEPNKDGSVEVSLLTEHKVGYDLMTTTYKVWNGGKIDKQITRIDTLKALGNTVVGVPGEEKVDEDGETYQDEKNLLVAKEYEFYITVK